MLTEKQNPEHFKHEANAFLSSARSVLQYARKEALTKAGGQQWYNATMAADALLPFMKNQRDSTIHDRPVQPGVSVTIYVNPAAVVASVLPASIVITDEAGNVIEQHDPAPAPPPKPNPELLPPPPATYTYHFAAWSGSQDVETLCQWYIGRLETIIADGVQRGFITG